MLVDPLHWVNQREQSGKHLGACVLAYRSASNTLEIAVATGDTKEAAWFFPSGVGARGEKGDKGDPGAPGADGKDGEDGVSPVLKDTFLLDVYEWTGNTTINPNATINLTALPLTKAINNGASTHGASRFTLPALAKTNGVQVTVRFTGNTTSNSAMEWRTQIRRVDGITVVSSVNVSKVAGVTDISNREAFINSFTNGETDPFSVDGFQLVMQNPTTSTIGLTSVSIRVSRILNQ